MSTDDVSRETEETPEEMADPAAPYGYLKDGITPKKKPGPSKGSPRVAAPTKAKTTAAPKPTRKAGPRARATAAAPDYRQGIAGLLQIPAFALGVAGRFNPAFSFDAATIVMHTPNVAEALNSLAQDEPRVAAVLDKVLQAGPYGAIIGAFIPLVAQIAVNHKKIPLGAVEALGVVEPERLMETIASE